ncbi:hypothetical protein BJ508DRAFT_331350 [Ascobolus immersus RN42]|uniref:Uncharacterized protein n=1 Tax=Ascobolus immersus RN42 TaxID=1160509 RepID=A0A3N4HQR4_ASCIM|nr:hypothetical protein BJ508DRAFT_331350 [Ascobolus immersus RN42]
MEPANPPPYNPMHPSELPPFPDFLNRSRPRYFAEIAAVAMKVHLLGDTAVTEFMDWISRSPVLRQMLIQAGATGIGAAIAQSGGHWGRPALNILLGNEINAFRNALPLEEWEPLADYKRAVDALFNSEADISMVNRRSHFPLPLWVDVDVYAMDSQRLVESLDVVVETDEGEIQVLYTAHRTLFQRMRNQRLEPSTWFTARKHKKQRNECFGHPKAAPTTRDVDIPATIRALNLYHNNRLHEDFERIAGTYNIWGEASTAPAPPIGGQVLPGGAVHLMMTSVGGSIGDIAPGFPSFQ